MYNNVNCEESYVSIDNNRIESPRDETIDKLLRQVTDKLKTNVEELEKIQPPKYIQDLFQMTKIIKIHQELQKSQNQEYFPKYKNHTTLFDK